MRRPLMLELSGRILRHRGLLVWANPVTAPTLAYHDLLLRGLLPGTAVWLPLLSWAVVAWVVGGWLFHRLSDSLAEAV